MTTGEIAISIWGTFLTAGLAALVWSQLRTFRDEIGELRREVRAEMGEVRGEIGEFRREVRAEFGELRREFHTDTDSLRSDLTQVALAVGVNRPRASEH